MSVKLMQHLSVMCLIVAFLNICVHIYHYTQYSMYSWLTGNLILLYGQVDVCISVLITSLQHNFNHLIGLLFDYIVPMTHQIDNYKKKAIIQKYNTGLVCRSYSSKINDKKFKLYYYSIFHRKFKLSNFIFILI